jgi:hypothetical protein
MRVALIGPPLSGKTTLFSAVASAEGHAPDLSRPDQEHLAVVKVPDERLEVLRKQFNPKKTTPAEIEFLDVPGMDLSDELGRSRARNWWPLVRQSDMLVFVLRAFQDDSIPAYRDRVEPEADLEEFKTELIFADLEQASNRIERLETSVKKPTPRRDEHLKELELMKRLAETLENDQPISSVEISPGQDKLIRSFAFLSQKPMMVVLNVGEDDLTSAGDETVGALSALSLSARIEDEIAQLEPDQRGEFLSDMGIEASARDRLVRACYRRMDLISFLTCGEDECRAWTLPAGTDAVTAAGEIHSDLARGFIRAETVAFSDYRQAGDMKVAKAGGKVRLEGKTYIVQDGDIINFRFSV